MRAEPDAMLRSGRLSLSVEASAAEKRLPFTTKLLVSGTEALRSQPPPLRHTRLHFARENRIYSRINGGGHTTRHHTKSTEHR